MSDRGTARILKGPLAWEILRFGTPLAVGMALQTTFNLVDAYLVARLPVAEAPAAIGALGICDQLAAIGSILSYGISTGTSALLAQQKGASQDHAFRKTAWQSILLVGLLSLVFLVVGLFGADPLVRILVGAKGEVAEQAVPYLRVIIGGSFSIFFLLQLTSIQRALGSAKTPVLLLVLGNVLNVLLAVVLVFGPDTPDDLFGAKGFLGFSPLAWAGATARVFHIPRMGMLGAAWATIVARTLVLIPNMIVLTKRFRILMPERGKRGLERDEARKILSIAWPSSAQFVLRIASMLLTSSLVARFFTTDTDQTATTAMGLVFRMDTLALFVAMGWGSAAQTFVGQNLGANEVVRARKSGWLVAFYDVLTNVAVAALFLRYGRPLLSVFSDASGPMAMAERYLTIVAPSYVALGVSVVLANAMAGAGATRTTMKLDGALLLFLQAPLSLLSIAFVPAPDGLFQCVALTSGLSAIVYGITYARAAWARSLVNPYSAVPRA